MGYWEALLSIKQDPLGCVSNPHLDSFLWESGEQAFKQPGTEQRCHKVGSWGCPYPCIDFFP